MELFKSHKSNYSERWISFARKRVFSNVSFKNVKYAELTSGRIFRRALKIAVLTFGLLLPESRITHILENCVIFLSCLVLTDLILRRSVLQPTPLSGPYESFMVALLFTVT